MRELQVSGFFPENSALCDGFQPLTSYHLNIATMATI